MKASYKQLCKYPEAPILIIDDSPESCALLECVLSDAGYTNITISHDPLQAVALWQTVNPDVFLVDYQMPGMDGLDVMQLINEFDTDAYVPIIMLTAQDDEDVKLKAMSLCAQDFAAKPFNHLDILARVNTVIHTSLLHKELHIKNAELDWTAQSALTQLESAQVSREKAELQLQHNLLHDALTELPNKALFYDYVDHCIENAEQQNKHFSITLISIENLRTINNTLGHEYGDVLLVKVAERLKAAANKTDYPHDYSNVENVARLAGNTFVLAISNLDSYESTLNVVKDLLNDLKQPYDLDTFNLDLIINIGVVHYPIHGTTTEDLLQHADVAAYNAKLKKIDFEVYSPEHDEFTTHKLMLMQDLKHAIIHNELELFLQPKIDFKDHKISGFEALLRWHHAQHGFIPPDKIVQTAEDTGLIEMLTKWVITHALGLQKKFYELGYDYSISINITASDLLNAEIISHVLNEVKIHRLKPEKITLEITEGSMIFNPQQAYDVIKIYRDAGIALSIDDFGTGYSSLAYLQKLPVNELKIDRSFVMDMHENMDNQMMVKSIIDIAHHLNLQVVAEGIENEAVYNLLHAFGCDVAQGYFLSRPLNFINILDLLKSFSLQSLRA